MTAKTGFAAQIRSHDNAVVIDLSGDINALAGDELKRVYQQAIDTADQMIVLNFEEVGYINSTGIALIVGLLMMARKEQRKMAAFGLSNHYREVFHITRLSDFIEISEHEKAVFSKNRNQEGDINHVGIESDHGRA